MSCTRPSAAALASRSSFRRCSRSSTPACPSPPRFTRSHWRPTHSPVGVINDSPGASALRARSAAASVPAVRTCDSHASVAGGPRTYEASVPGAPPCEAEAASKKPTVPPSSPASAGASCSSASTCTASRYSPSTVSTARSQPASTASSCARRGALCAAGKLASQAPALGFFSHSAAFCKASSAMSSARDCSRSARKRSRRSSLDCCSPRRRCSCASTWLSSSVRASA